MTAPNETTAQQTTQDEPTLKTALTEYMSAFYRLAVVEVQQKTADIAATMAFSSMIALMAILILFFIGIAGAIALAVWLQSYVWGFLLMGVCILLLFLVMYFTRKKIFYPFVRNLIIRNIYE